jgi:hypothetical protein
MARQLADATTTTLTGLIADNNEAISEPLAAQKRPSLGADRRRVDQPHLGSS